MKKIILALIFCGLLFSCSSKKEILYFQDIENTSLVKVDQIYSHPTIEVNDILKIDLTALSQAAILPYQFDKNMGGQVQQRQGDILKLEGYLVDEKGNINYPGLGSVKVEGYTTQELQKKFETQLSQFVKDPTVRIRLVNFKVSVIGEVKAPGTYTIAEETVSLPQALGLAGDLTIQGERREVLLIRQTKEGREHVLIDLTSSEWMNSEYYFLKQNDVVYVQPNNAKVKSAGIIGNLGTLLSVFSILLSTAILIFR